MADTDELIQQLLELDEEQLKIQLGIQAQTMEAESRGVPMTSIEAEGAPKAGINMEVLEMGQQLFDRINTGAYDILCGNPFPDSGETLQQLEKALEENYAKATGFLAPVLVSGLGLAPAVATIIATIIIKKIAQGSSNVICETWQKSLKQTSSEQ